MSGIAVGAQIGIGILEILKAYNTFKAQNPGMTEDEALAAFAAGVSDFDRAVERWNAAGQRVAHTAT